MTETQRIVDFAGARARTQAQTDQKTISSLNLLTELLDEARGERDEAVREREGLQARMKAARAILDSSEAKSREWKRADAAKLEQASATPLASAAASSR